MSKQTAKIFMNGRSQAVRLPAEFRFDSDEVFIRRDLESGDVILSSRPDSWQDFFSFLDQFGPVEEEFMAQRNLDAHEDKGLL